MPEVDLAIVDEAHVRNQWLEKQFGSEDWGKKPVIGLSATPWSKGLGLIYDELIAPITMRGLIEQGRLLNFRVFAPAHRSDEHTSELQSLMRISYAVFCLTKKKTQNTKKMYK